MSSNTDFKKYYSEELDIYIITREEELIYKHIMRLSAEDVGVELRNLHFLSSQLDEHYVNVMLKAYQKRLSNISAEISKSKTPKPSIFSMVVDEIISTMFTVKTTELMCDFMFGKPSTRK